MGNSPSAPKDPGPHWGARVVWASTALDRAYQAFDRARGEVVLALATDRVLDGCNDLIYGAMPLYRADAATFRPSLFTWEQRAIEHFFPPPPARVLIGGVGGGREAFALAELGYDVVAFDPSRQLIDTMLTRCREQSQIVPLLGGYGELPNLRDALSGVRVDLSAFGLFDAGILGWASYSHLRSEEQREHALSEFRNRVQGPILVSFFHDSSTADKAPKPRRLRRWLPGKFNRDPGNAFSVHVGFYHRVSHERLNQTAARSGLRVLDVTSEENTENWPHAVLISSSAFTAHPDTADPPAEPPSEAKA